MARTQFIDVPDELKNAFNKSIERRDRFVLGVAQGHKRLPSKAQKKLLSRTAVVNSPMEGRGSLFKYLAPLWRSLTTMQKDAWKAAAAFSSINGWQLFVSDNAARIKNSLTLGVPPSDLWQVRAGYIELNGAATSIRLSQAHPLDYYVTQKVPGQPWKYNLVLLRETFSLPLELQIRYKSDLIPVELETRARFFARIWMSYQGQDVQHDIEINFEEETDWTLATVDTTGLLGILVGYTLYIEIVGYTGEIMFDNIRAVHSGTNWARDPRCDDISKTFQKAFALVPPFWLPEDLPEGASFSSQYPPALS